MESIPDRPFLIGITGGIGSGKTTISRIFETLEVPIYYADDRASWLMDNDQDLQNKLTLEFGQEAIENGKTNKDFFRKLVFSNEEARIKLNSLVHPAVGRDFGDWVKSNSEFPYLAKEAALLIEAGSYKELDLLIGVFAPPEERIKRVLKRDPFRTREDVQNIMSRQMQEDEMRQYCQVQIENDGRKGVLEEILNFDKTLREHLLVKAS